MKSGRKWRVFWALLGWFIVEGVKEAMDEHMFRRQMDVRRRRPRK